MADIQNISELAKQDKYIDELKAKIERLEERLTNQKKAVEDALEFGRQQSAEVERLKAANEKCEWEVQQAKIEAERRRQELTVMLNERLMPLEQENARLQNELGYLAFRRSYSECEEALIAKIREILKGGDNG